jgi:tetratricopeptide (TPR) repeat protein
MHPPDEVGLGPEGEQDWLRLRRQVEWAEGFWLCFIFAPSPRATGILRQRTERLLRGRTLRLSQYEPSQPEELPAVLRELLIPEARDVGCHWVEALHLDSGAQPEGPWHQAWLRLVVLMNERRDALRRHLRGGLVLVAPPRMKPYFRQMASDLWSVRAMEIELLPVAEFPEERGRPDVERRGAGTSGSEPGGAIPDADFALAELLRIQSGNLENYQALASVLTRAVEGLLASGRVSEALETARQAWERIRTRVQEDPRSSAGVLHALALSEEAEGDFAAAAEHLEQAVELTRGQTDRQRLFLLSDLGRLAYTRRDLREANRACEEALALCRERRQSQGETPEALRDLSVSLNKVGDIRRARGELSAAAEAHEESLALSRQLREVMGQTPEALRDLSVSLNKVGDIRRARGELSAAAEAYEESLALIRQVREILGDVPQINQDLRYCLAQVTAARQALGDESGAQAAQAEADALDRQSD